MWWHVRGWVCMTIGEWHNSKELLDNKSLWIVYSCRCTRQSVVYHLIRVWWFSSEEHRSQKSLILLSQCRVLQLESWFVIFFEDNFLSPDNNADMEQWKRCGTVEFLGTGSRLIVLWKIFSNVRLHWSYLVIYIKNPLSTYYIWYIANLSNKKGTDLKFFRFSA